MTQNEQSLYDEIKSSTNIISGKEFKEILLAISQIANDMVKDTLGPYGSTTIIDDSTFTYPTKDGFTVLKGLHFNDPIYNVLYNILKQIMNCRNSEKHLDFGVNPVLSVSAKSKIIIIGQAPGRLVHELVFFGRIKAEIILGIG